MADVRDAPAGPSDVGRGPDKTCDHTDCLNEPRWQLGLKFWAPGKRGAAITAEMGIYVCETHGQDAIVEGLMGDAGWKQISESIRAVGRVMPERSLTEVTLLPFLNL